MTKIKKENLNGKIKTPDGHTLTMSLIASIISLEKMLILLDKNGRQRSYTKLTGEKGKTQEDANDVIETILTFSKKDPMLDLGNGNYVRCSDVESIHNHRGRDFNGLVISGSEDVTLAFLQIDSTDIRVQVAGKLDESLKSYEAGKFVQPDLSEFLSTN